MINNENRNRVIFELTTFPSDTVFLLTVPHCQLRKLLIFPVKNSGPELLPALGQHYNIHFADLYENEMQGNIKLPSFFTVTLATHKIKKPE